MLPTLALIVQELARFYPLSTYRLAGDRHQHTKTTVVVEN
jgi:hypothetical protein